MPTRDERKALFIKAFKKTGSIKGASEKTKIGRRTHYDWLASDPEYKQEFEDGRADFAESVEDVMFKRIFNDPKCHHVLIIFALKGLMRDKYGDRPTDFNPNEPSVWDKLNEISDKPKIKKAARVIADELRTADDPLGFGDGE